MEARVDSQSLEVLTYKEGKGLIREERRKGKRLEKN